MPDRNEIKDDSRSSLWPMFAMFAAVGAVCIAYWALKKNRDILPDVDNLLDMCEGAVSELELRLTG